MAAYQIFILLFLLEFIVGEKLLNPTKKCIPTATIRGACHLCVCDIDGLYHCRREEICQPNIKSFDPNMRECEANELYREGTNFCSCAASGHWQSNNCRERFQLLRLKKDPIMKHISTDIACKENGLYITDCNVCLCGASGYINFDSCTSRSCPKRLKGDYCNPGDAFRSAKELCICSYMNFFLDHLCIRVVDEVVQPIQPMELSRIIDIESHTSIDEEQCEGNITLSIDCNTCVCHKTKYICTERICFDDKASLRTKEKSKKSVLLELKNDHEKCNSVEGDKCNVEEPRFPNITIISSSRNKDLPQIKEGDPCTPGKSYKMDCNRCHCSAAKKLLCTKTTCVDWSKFINHKSKLRHAKKPTASQRLKAGKAIHNNKQSLHNRKPERFTKPPAKQGQSDLPLLPKGKCFPGRIYRKKCRRCFCNDLGESLCSANENGACKLLEDGHPIPVRVPADIRPVFEREELKQDIPILPSASEKCEPGKTYQVSCNHCVCTERHNLICTRSLCLSFEDINRIEADERTGNKCVGTKVTEESCIKCQCISEKLSCQSIPDCYTHTRNRLSKGTNATLKMQIDPIIDKCIPGAVYKDNCNHCYCQPNASLRCTQKKCLNYAQAKILTDQFKKLETEGL